MPANPICAVVEAVNPYNCSNSVFEAKAGIRLAEVALCGKEPAEELRANVLVKRITKTAKEAIKTSGMDWAQGNFGAKDPKLKKISTILKRNIDALCLTRFIVPDEPWGHKVITPEIAALSPSHLRFGATHFGGIEARLYLEGGETLVGFKIESVPGTTWADKRRALSCMTVDGWTELLISTTGFCSKPTAGSLVLIPSGFIITSASRGGVYMRWCVSSDQADSLRTASTLETLIKEFPEIRQPQTGYAQYLDWLKANIVG